MMMIIIRMTTMTADVVVAVDVVVVVAVSVDVAVASTRVCSPKSGADSAHKNREEWLDWYTFQELLAME